MSNIPFNNDKTTVLAALNKIAQILKELTRITEEKELELGDTDKGPATVDTLRVVLENDNYNDLRDVANNTRYNGLVNTPGITVAYTYYTGVAAGNPSGSANIQTEVYTDTLTSTILLTRTFSWDASDRVIGIVNT